MTRTVGGESSHYNLPMASQGVSYALEDILMCDAGVPNFERPISRFNSSTAAERPHPCRYTSRVRP
jgi:hypothetical protein